MKSPLKTKHARWGIFLLFLLGLYFMVMILLVPRYIKAPLNQQLSGFDLQADYEQLSINPLTLNIHIKQLQLQTKQQETLLTAAETTIDWQLLPLLSKTFNLDRLILRDADIYFEFDQQNNLIMPVLPKSSTSDKPATWDFEMGQINIENTNINLQKGEQSYVIKQLNASHQPSTAKNQHPIDLSLRTETEGQFTVVGGQQADNGGWQMDWQLQNWPLAGLSDWLLTAQNSSQIIGDVSAQGALSWLPEQLPNITINQLELNVEQGHFADVAVKELQLNADAIAINLNDNSFSLNTVTSPKAHWQLKNDPYDAFTKVMQLLADDDDSQQAWQVALTELEIENWQLETPDNNETAIYVVNKISWHSAAKTSAGDYQKILTAELLIPNSEALQITAEAQINPLLLSGHIFTERLDLTAFNTLITPLSGWQFQQADIAIDSPFCYRENQYVMSGLWSTGQLTAANDSQFIAIKQFQLAKLLLDNSRYHLYLNQVSAISGEGGEVTTSSSSSPPSPASTLNESANLSTTDATEQPVWQVFIGLPEQPACQP